MFLLFLKYSCSLYIVEWMWRGPCQTFCVYEGCFWRCGYENRKDTEMLTQVRGEEVTIKYRAKAPFASKFWGLWDLGKVKKYFTEPVIKVVKSRSWAASAKIFLAV